MNFPLCRVHQNTFIKITQKMPRFNAMHYTTMREKLCSKLYEVRILTWVDYMAFINKGNFHLLYSDEFKILFENIDTSKMTMLDVGSGNGNVTQQMSMLFKYTYACEISFYMRIRLLQKEILLKYFILYFI